MKLNRVHWAPWLPIGRSRHLWLALGVTALAACAEPDPDLTAPDARGGETPTEAGTLVKDAGPVQEASRPLQDAASPRGSDARVEGGAGGTTASDASLPADARAREDAALPGKDAAASTDAASPSSDASTSDAGLSAALVPAQGVLLGQYYGDGNIEATKAKLGRTLPIHLVYYTFTDDWTRGSTAADLSAGRIPLVNWELFDTPLDEILSGTHDAMLSTRARAAKALGKPFFLDFGAEMNGDWSPWGGAQNGMSATKYLAAYKRVHDAFVKEGADNVVWLFCPNVTDEPRATWNQALNYYPGDDYVDWTCVDGYNWGTSNGGGWQSFQDVFKAIYAKLATKGKPILIGEMASAEVGGDKAAWIDQLVPTLRSDFPLIKGLVWFDVNKETDWRISSSPKAQAAFVKFAADPYTNP